MKVIIFDFDGTIADSFGAVLAIANRLANEFGYAPVQPKDVKPLRNLSSREIIKQANLPVIKVLFLLRRLRRELNREIQYLQPIPGIKEALVTLKQQGHQLGIVTSNSQENVVAFLENQNLAELFDFVSSGLTLLGKGRIIQQVLRRYRLDPDSVIYVGDETRDIEAARTVRIQVIAVGWGFNSSEILAAQNPDALIHTPEELVQMINQSCSVIEMVHPPNQTIIADSTQLNPLGE